MAGRMPPRMACLVLLSRPPQLTLHATTRSTRRKPTACSSTRRTFATTPSCWSQSIAPKVVRGEPKLFSSADEAVADLKSGSTVLSAGFGLCGVAETLIQAIARRGAQDLHSLTAVSNNAGIAKVGGLALLADAGQLSRLILSFLGSNKTLEKNYLTGKVAIELCPQGTIAERIRAGGAGIPAFYTPTGVATLLQEGNIPVRLSSDGKEVIEHGKKREVREFKGRKYLMEEAITGDVAILRAWKVDEAGNCIFRYTTKAFGPIMAKAATMTIVEAEEIVPVGSIDPNDVDLPGIFVDRIVPATADKHIEIKKLRNLDNNIPEKAESPEIAQRNRIAKRAAKELKKGFYVNLGVGIPTLAPSYLPKGHTVWIQSENGILGMGPYPTEEEVDADIINAGKETVTLVPGASTFDSSESFGMIRGGHVDVSILGALQVAANGDLANYMIPGKVFKGMGGAMDLVSNPNNTKIVVATSHVAKDGTSKIVQKCNLPLTGAKCVVTLLPRSFQELQRPCVFEVDREKGELTLTELAPGVDVDGIRAKTDAEFAVAPTLKRISMERATPCKSPPDEKLEDAASAPTFFEYEASAEVRRILLKTDIRILPILALLFLCSFFDRTNVGNAKIFGLENDTGITDHQYDIGLAVFYLFYVCSELPSNLVLKKASPRVWLPFLAVLWGIITMCLGFISSYGSFVAVRALLGVAEGGLLPGMVLYLSAFYKRSDLALRIGLFYTAASLSGAFGGLLARGLVEIGPRGGLEGWRWIFIIEGLLTVVCGIIAAVGLPNSLATATFLTPAERELAQGRILQDKPSQGDNTNSESESLKWSEVLRGITDISMWLSALAYFAILAGLYSFGLFLPTIIEDSGFTTNANRVQLWSVIPYAVATVFTVLIAFLSDRLKLRGVVMLFTLPFAIVGYAVIANVSNAQVEYGMTFLMATGMYASVPCVLVWNSNNSAGHYKRATTSAMQLAVANCGGILFNVLWCHKVNRDKANGKYDRYAGYNDDRDPNFMFVL
ncbi:hypothetical protein UA08_06835 [Talaromyces atroroseus]|uniref:Major facilitator superfamily (MFS) profile domain-containing protein n=1 Tax=Talaromyces atroroseus TaxID=1441469 RepID=A0A225AAY2_TALAT|nr:hypothetical protein UA08_06835 [Talaromyces atroroseus]OKL58171.1 hypothetical protein UA08_06835 [Talaromyces atroroseus]